MIYDYQIQQGDTSHLIPALSDPSEHIGSGRREDLRSKGVGRTDEIWKPNFGNSHSKHSGFLFIFNLCYVIC